MKRIVLSICLASLSVGCFGACGSSESTATTSETTTTTTTTTTTGGASDTTTEPTTTSEPTIVTSDDACTTDADCVPAGCCHPAACVAQANAPSCGESVCTTDCRYGTLDCGGACLCQAGHCAARLSQLPNIPGISDVQ